MHIATRHLCLTVLIAVLAGHASFAVHAASHGAVDGLECKLCMSFGHFSEAVASDPKSDLQPVPLGRSSVDDSDAPISHEAAPFLQRGPPISN
jgi:hypothetical protein